jgi:cell division protein FtsI (penicillin-binding protein 3)
VQRIVEDELSNSVARSKALRGAGIVMDVRTGELLALASFPSYDPNRVTGLIPSFMPTDYAYEPGSTMSPITIAKALDTGAITPEMLFDASQPLRVGRFQISDGYPSRRAMNARDAIRISSQVALARIGDRAGSEALQAIFRALHFNDRLPFEISTGSPLWPRSWGRLTTMTASYGHGIAVTPLHLACAYAALVNGGTWRPPTLLRQYTRGAPGTRVFTQATSAQMREWLREAVKAGTGKKADITGYDIGGKTGTPSAPTYSGYSSKKANPIFAGAFPMAMPRYVVVVMLEGAKETKENIGIVTSPFSATPAAGRIIERAAAVLDADR